MSVKMDEIKEFHDVAEVARKDGHDVTIGADALICVDNGITKLEEQRDKLLRITKDLVTAFDAFSKEVNWAASALSATTISMMNQTVVEARKLNKELESDY